MAYGAQAEPEGWLGEEGGLNRGEVPLYIIIYYMK
jgi:hypothetical protein